jgi:hypothetical protein
MEGGVGTTVWREKAYGAVRDSLYMRMFGAVGVLLWLDTLVGSRPNDVAELGHL